MIQNIRYQTNIFGKCILQTLETYRYDYDGYIYNADEWRDATPESMQEILLKFTYIKDEKS